MIAETKPAFRPDLEGLRGVAVLLIVAFHAGIPGFRGGYIGVDVFFVLSGYLITALLVRGIRPAEFYARRARRILPALMAMLAVTMAASMVLSPPLEQKNVAQAALSTAGFAGNIYFQHQAADYFGPEADSNALLHTWSLGVEEQFYLGWPLLIWLALRSRFSNRRMPAAMGAVAAISLAACFWLAARHPPWAFYSSFARAWEFAAGALVCFVPALGKARWLGWMGMIAILASAVEPIGSGANPGIAAIVPVLGTAAVLASGAGLAARALSHFSLRALGRLSYSWYLWHWPVMVLVGGRVGGLPVWLGIVCAAASLGLAALTYFWIENPIRFHPRLMARPALSLMVGAALAFAGFAAGLAWRQIVIGTAQYQAYAQPMNDVPRFYQYDCRTEFLDSSVRECSFGDVQSSTIVTLLGDSHAAQWLPPLESIATRRGLRLETFIKMACPAAAVPAYQSKIGREESQCAAWRNAALDRIARLKPAVAVVATSVEYVNASARPLSSQQWLEGTREMLARFDSAGVRTLLLRDTPKAGFNVPLCLARVAWRGSGNCILPRREALDEAAYRGEAAAAQSFSRVRVADLTDAICGAAQCPVVQDGRIVFRDRDHLTASFAETLAPALEAQLAPLLP